MIYKYKYKTPDNFSDIIITSDGEYLTGLYFESSKTSLKYKANYIGKYLPIFKETTKWLDIYFSGNIPNFTPKYKISNLTPFRKEVIDIINNIPYGKTITYGDISSNIALNRGIEKMSAQAVGGAVGWNPICIIIPCHRVIGSKGNLVGYGGGLANKLALLNLENNKKYLHRNL